MSKVKNWKEFNESNIFEDNQETSIKDCGCDCDCECDSSKEDVIKSDSEFKEYAKTILKKAFKDDYDQAIADKTIKGILDKHGDDYGAAVGALENGLSK